MGWDKCPRGGDVRELLNRLAQGLVEDRSSSGSSRRCHRRGSAMRDRTETGCGDHAIPRRRAIRAAMQFK